MAAAVIIQNIVFFGIGGLVLVSSAILCVLWPVLFENQLRTELVLTNTSKSYDLWKDTPVPMYLEIHMFNWTNPMDTLKKGAKPNFVEMGPYVFSEHHTKVNIIWNDNGTVTFKQVRKWEFVQELSNGSLSDEVTNINVIAMTVGKIIKQYQPLGKYINKIINEIIKFEENSPAVTKTVKELLFDGYDDKFLTLMKQLEPILKRKLPFYKFGWFYQRNASENYDGVFNMKTGLSSLDDLGNIIMWNYYKKTKAYTGKCAIVEGTTGELWPTDSSRNEEIKIFATDICSSLSLKLNGTTSVHGVDGSLHVGDDSVFDNGQKLKENLCFCYKGDCPPKGARDISLCRYGAPAYVSYPHFYLADASYRAMVDGMKPSIDLHKFYISLEKVTSIPLEVHARLQINIRTIQMDEIKFYKQLPKAYMPMLWFDQRAVLTPDLASQLKQVDFLGGYLETIFLAIAVIGLILFVVGLILWLKRIKAEHRTPPTPLLTDNSESS